LVLEKTNDLCPICTNTGNRCGDQGDAAYYHRCMVCDTVWLSDRAKYNISKKDIYDESYVTKMYGDNGLRGYRRLAEKHFYLLHFIAGAMGRRGHGPFKFAEIGFSLPSVITYFFGYGYDVTGLDIRVSEKVKKELRPLIDAGRLRFVEADFETWDTKQNFDVLWMSHVLEHLEDTLEGLKKIRKLLKETGVAYISSPDAENMKDLGVQGLIGHMHPEEHLFMYSIKTFAELCSEAGLKMCFWERYGDPIPGQFEFVTKMEWRALVVPQERHLS